MGILSRGSPLSPRGSPTTISVPPSPPGRSRPPSGSSFPESWPNTPSPKEPRLSPSTLAPNNWNCVSLTSQPVIKIELLTIPGSSLYEAQSQVYSAPALFYFRFPQPVENTFHMSEELYCNFVC